jgi:hypothetical protein
MIEPLSKTDPNLYDRIKALHENIWQKHIDPTTKRPWCSEKRNLTDHEKSCLFSLMSSRRVICCLSDSMGFTLIVSLYSYPSSSSEKPEFLISFSQRHMEIKNSGLSGRAEKGEKTAWNIFSKFTHTKRNRRLVEFFDLPPLKKREQYAY